MVTVGDCVLFARCCPPVLGVVCFFTFLVSRLFLFLVSCFVSVFYFCFLILFYYFALLCSALLSRCFRADRTAYCSLDHVQSAVCEVRASVSCMRA